MKNKILFVGITLLLGNFRSDAQLWDLDGSGNVTTTTSGTCSIQSGIINLAQPSTDLPRYITANSAASSLNILSGTTNTDGAYIGLHAIYDGGGMNLHTTSSGKFLFFNYSGGVFNPLMQIGSTGDVNINSSLAINAGTIDLTNTISDIPRYITANSTKSSLNLLSGYTNTDGAYIGLHASLDGGGMNLHTISSGKFLFFNYSGGVFNPLMQIESTGDVNINSALAVNAGKVNLANTMADVPRYVIANSTKSSLNLLSGYTNTDGAYIGLHASGDGGGMNLHSMKNGSFLFYNWNGASFNLLMDVRNNGAVVIGDGSLPVPSPGVAAGYNLYVQHGILTEKLKVANSTDGFNWSDFVFDQDYNLPSLCDVESYIASNKHLPQIPSAKEVAKEGIDVASMDAKLLQKIEELTLYAIEQQKHIQQQDKKIEMLIKKVNK